MDTITAFFRKSGHFFSIFKKRVREASPPPHSPLVARLSFDTAVIRVGGLIKDKNMHSLDDSATN